MKFLFDRIELPSFLITETPLVLIGTFLLRLSKFFIFLYAAKILGPTLWGSWNILLILSMYFSHFHFGLINAFNREGPLHLDNISDLNSIKNNIVSGVIISLIFFTIILSFTLLLIDSIDFNTAILFLLFFVFNQLYYFIEIYFKVKIEFKKISYYQIVRSVILLSSAFFLISNFGINGFILSLCIPDVLFVLFNIKIFSHFTFNPNVNLLKDYIKIGLPIMIVGFTFMLIQTVDRLIIMQFFENNQLGIYSLGTTVFQALLIFPQILSMQFYPRMIRSYGLNKDINSLKESFLNQLLLSLLIVIPIVLVGIFLVPIIINNYLYDYQGSILVSQILICAVLFLPITFVSGNVFNILDLQKKYLFFQLIAIAINLILSLVAISFNFGIEGVAFATFVSFLFYSLIMIYYLINYVFK